MESADKAFFLYSIFHATIIISSFIKKNLTKIAPTRYKNKLCYNFAYKKDHIITMVHYIPQTFVLVN